MGPRVAGGGGGADRTAGSEKFRGAETRAVVLRWLGHTRRISGPTLTKHTMRNLIATTILAGLTLGTAAFAESHTMANRMVGGGPCRKAERLRYLHCIRPCQCCLCSLARRHRRNLAETHKQRHADQNPDQPRCGRHLADRRNRGGRKGITRRIPSLQRRVGQYHRVRACLYPYEDGNFAKVGIADVNQSNGVIHVIEGVPLPKQAATQQSKAALHSIPRAAFSP